jgi:hypothetical protein
LRVDWRMEHISGFHNFNPMDSHTYPKVNAPVQVRFANGRLVEGLSPTFFAKVDAHSAITGWRYIKDTAVD